MSKWKNKGLWVSLFALVAFILNTYGLMPKLGLTNETFDTLVNLILPILIMLGVISDPSSGSWYADKKE